MNKRRYLGAVLCVLIAGACGAEPGDSAPDDARVGEARQALVIDDDVVRFLEQASMGPTKATYDDIVLNGGSAGGGFTWWIGDQIAKPQTLYVSGTDVRDQFFEHAINDPDQLRQRVAFALSQIFVVSRIKLDTDDWIIPYLNMLGADAFGNLRTIFSHVAESAAMGDYLDNANNFVKTKNGAVITAVAPNENFARELMQLFSVGLCELKPNGTFVGGVCTPPYTQDHVEDFAHAMSGWTYDDGTGVCPANVGKKRSKTLALPSMTLLACNNDNHDYTQQTLLNRFNPANTYQTGAGTPVSGWSTHDAMEKPLDLVNHESGILDDLFNHPNVGPFIGKQLIQHLVTGNPAPAYVSRVTQVFNDDGTGVRGNMTAVITAILTDVEARTLASGVKFGHLREPALFITGAMRLFGTTPDGAGLRGQSAAMGQDVHHSPSVFNYFPPSYPLPGSTDVVSPEFGIEDTNTILARTNFVDTLVYNPTAISATTALNLAGVPATNAADIVAYLDAYAMHKKMPAAMSTYLTGTALPALAIPDMQKRAVYLVLSSSQYQVMR